MRDSARNPAAHSTTSARRLRPSDQATRPLGRQPVEHRQALRPALACAERWQGREREGDEHLAAGHVAVHESTEDFLGHLDELNIE